MSPTAAQEYISDVRRIRQSLRKGEIVLIDDDSTITELLASLCHAIGEKARKFSDIESAKSHLINNYHAVKMAVIDYSINGVYSDELIEVCSHLNVPCIIHTGRSEKLNELQDKFPGIIVILKPSPIERLLKELL